MGVEFERTQTTQEFKRAAWGAATDSMNSAQAQMVSGRDGTRCRRILDTSYATGLHGPTRAFCPRQLPTNHDHDGECSHSIHYQTDQPSIPAAPAAVRLCLAEQRR